MIEPQHPLSQVMFDIARRTPTHPGGVVDEAAAHTGWRLGVAAAWREIEHVPGEGAVLCRHRIECLGNGGPGRS